MLSIRKLAHMERMLRRKLGMALLREARQVHMPIVGAYGRLLGVRPSTPCILVHDRHLCRRIRSLLNMPPRPPRAYLCHGCDDRRCINVEHLFWGTAKDNAVDMSIKRRVHGASIHLRVRLLAVQLAKEIACDSSVLSRLQELVHSQA